ncbi:MAG: HD domain-containing phosphohydrolase [Candidatus Omnitrophota bacterium]
MAVHYKRYESMKILLDVSRIVGSSLDMDKVSDLVLKESIKALGADHASLFLADESRAHLMLARAEGFSADEIDNIKLMGSWEVINGQLVRKKKSLIVNDVRRSSIFKDKMLPFMREKIPVQSFLAVPLKKDGIIVGSLIASNRKRPGHLFTKKDEELLAALSNHIAIALLNARLYQSLKNLFLSTTKSLVRAIDAKDQYTSGHSERVMKYSYALGKALKLAGEELENLKLSSLLHDVGKIGIRENVLSKPSKLSAFERTHIKHHPLIGVKIVEGIDAAHKIVRGILEHHERFDGSGYPNGLKGRAISLQGRIIAVADTFDALTTNRPYQRGYTRKEALFEIKRGSSTQFDPKLVKAFMLSFSRRPEIWK